MSAQAQSRRGFLAALASLTAAGGSTAAIATPYALAASTASPEAPLIEAGVTWSRAVSAFDEATRNHEDAYRAFSTAMGPCPPELVMSDWEADQLVLHRVRKASGLRLIPEWDDGGPETIVNRWGGGLLRTVISWWPKVNGRGGTTPHTIRRLKALLPEADARDAKQARLRSELGTVAAYRRLAKTRTTASEAESPILTLPAATIAGVAVKARLASYRMAKWAEINPDHKQSGYLTAVVDAALAANGEA